jgi:hypothetical protein
MRLAVYAAIASALMITGCTQATPPPPAAASVFTADTTAGRHETTGVLHVFRDAGYPMFFLEVGPADAAADDPRNLGILFNNEGEGTALQSEQISPMVGKSVNVTYEVTPEVDVREILQDSRSIHTSPDGSPYVPAASDQTITGVVSGIMQTEGDLPTRVTITAPDGAKVEFDAFVSGSPLENAEGKTVTLIYTMGTRTDLVGLTLAQ